VKKLKKKVQQRHRPSVETKEKLTVSPESNEHVARSFSQTMIMKMSKLFLEIDKYFCISNVLNKSLKIVIDFLILIFF
jgi:hypothetical protein